jgi:hypothetical protein
MRMADSGQTVDGEWWTAELLQTSEVLQTAEVLQMSETQVSGQLQFSIHDPFKVKTWGVYNYILFI